MHVNYVHMCALCVCEVMRLINSTCTAHCRICGNVITALCVSMAPDKNASLNVMNMILI